MHHLNLVFHMTAKALGKLDQLLKYLDEYGSKVDDKPKGAYRIVTRENDKGGPEKMIVEHFDLSEFSSSIAEDEILIEVKAAGINYIDTYHRSGLYPNPSNTLGKEGSGIVIKIGKNVKNYVLDDYVCWFGVQGSYSTHIKLKQNFKNLIKIPPFLIEKYKSYVLFEYNNQKIKKINKMKTQNTKNKTKQIRNRNYLILVQQSHYNV